MIWKILAILFAVLLFWGGFLTMDRQKPYNAYMLGFWAGVLAFMAVTKAFGW
jgi:hypothetical protein